MTGTTMSKTICLFLSCTILTLTLLGAAYGQVVDPEKVKKHIYTLASDKMKGRGTGSKELNKAGKYIERQFKSYKLTPLGTDGFKQPFTAKVRRVVVKDSIRQAHNVIGLLDNGAAHTIVVGAHYDHLGMGRQGSSRDTLPEGKLHNGADDNASGVAGLLEIARHFSTNDVTEPYNILFIAFSAEELGLVGSRHFVNEPTLPLENMHFMLNFDMIGRYQPEQRLAIIGSGTTPSWPAVFENITSDIDFWLSHDGSGGSDQTSFYAKDIPVLFFHTGGHEDYHMPGDEPQKINYPATVSIIDLAIEVIESAMKHPKFDFTPTKSM